LSLLWLVLAQTIASKEGTRYGHVPTDSAQQE
jgi:hypothetical protein